MKDKQTSPFWRHVADDDEPSARPPVDFLGVEGIKSFPLPAKNLTTTLVDRLIDDIKAGRLKPGGRLPTEKEMIVAYGVSKTVIREAVAALRSSGYVTTRHGVGTFVIDFSRHRGFQIAQQDIDSVHEIMNVLQFRIAIETESVALAAEYATETDLAAIDAALKQFEEDIASGNQAIDSDFGFHRAIAKATGNPLFLRFLDFLGSVSIPRSRLEVTVAPDPAITRTLQRRYLKKLQTEHRRIQQAIVEHNQARARRAMRNHLYISWERYRQFVDSR